MIDRDIVIEKVSNIQQCLKRIREKTQGDPETLQDIDIQDIFILNLQRAIQSAIDLAAHIVADEGLGMPESLRENFSLLQKAGILTSELSNRLGRMVGFRNIAVHEYQNIEIEVLQAILNDRLVDLVRYYKSVLEYYDMNKA